MKNFFKFILLVLLLNVVRYLVAGPIEGSTIMSPMHQPMTDYPLCFNLAFGTMDWVTSFFYNFMVWLCATWVFYVAHPIVSGNYIVRSFKVYGIMCLFFISISAVFMNHYTDGIKIFYRYAMIDSVITFSIVALANGLIFPRFLRTR